MRVPTRLRPHPLESSLAGRRALRSQVAASTWIAGSTLGLLGLIAPQKGAATDVVLGLALLGMVAGALVLWRFERFSEFEAGLVTVIGSMTIAVAAVAAGAGDGPVPLILLWNVVYAFGFLGRRHAVGQFLVMAALYAGVLVIDPPTSPAASQWIISVGTWAVVGGLIAVLRGRLELAADTDHLTGLLNRRGFESRAAAELARARRLGAPVGLVVFDLDGFKRINDEHGHPAGDAVLVAIADRLRAGDVAARLGGDEFAVMLPDQDAAGTTATAERLAATLRAEAGASFGTSAAPDDGTLLADLLIAADRRLYAAKARRPASSLFSGR